MNLTQDTVCKNAALGFVKIWQSDPCTGDRKLLIDKKNTVMLTGADILSQALAGFPNARVSHMYLSYATSPPGSYVIDKANSTFLADSNHGYLRIPLAFTPSYSTSNPGTYNNNIVVFTTILNNTSGLVASGSQTITNGSSQFYEVGLVAAYDPNDTGANHSKDKVFARLAFTPITYDNSFNLTISWGVQFLS